MYTYSFEKLEILNQLFITHELDYISSDDYNVLRQKIESITNNLNALRKYQINK